MTFEHYRKSKAEFDGLQYTFPGCKKMTGSFLPLLNFLLLVIKLHTEKDGDNSPGLEEILINVNISPFQASPLESCF